MNNFLDSVLPTQGTYCAVGIKSKLVKQSFHDTVADIDAVAVGLDARGVDAYYALASFADPALGRKADNAAYLRAFFLDLDCGTGKPYNDPAQACSELGIFVRTTGMPEPTIVFSGGGVHVYWPLLEDLDADKWLGMAKRLKTLCRENNLHADPAVTADAARILRVPGTNNYKEATPRPVRIVNAGLPVAVEDIEKCLPPAPVDLTAAKQFGMDEATRNLAVGDYPTCDFVRIVQRSLAGNGCAQMTKAITEVATLEEPLWRAALSVAVRCEDGQQAIHKLSKGHPGYSGHSTEAKAAETKGPYTCDWYRINYSAGCAGCTQRISSPILVGKRVEMPAETAAVTVAVPNAPPASQAFIVETSYGDADEGEGPRITVEIPPYPYPFFRGPRGGVFKRVKTESGEEVEIEVYSRDLYITGRFFDSEEFGDGLGEMVSIDLHMQRDGIRRFYAPVAELFSKDKMRDTVIKNGVMAYGKQLDPIMAYFSTSIRKLQAQFSANKTRSQMGWTPDMQGFVVGEVEYSAAGNKLAPPSSGTRQLAPAFIPRGNLEGWKKIADFYNRPGLEPHALALFFGFGAPLLKFIGGTVVKGALVHLKSNASGSGKTTAQLVVNSIFGNPTDLLMTKDDTYASKMHRIGMLNSIAFTVDEITNTTDEELSDTAYGVTTGRARHRMEASANKMRVNNTSWCNITITSANSSLIDKLSQLKSTSDGELKRLLEIDVPTLQNVTKSDIDEVFSTLGEHYGIAGPIFMQYVLNNMDEVRSMLAEMQKKIDDRLVLNQTDRFYSCILACAFVGAIIAERCGLHSIEISRVYKYALEVVASNREAQIGSIGSPLLIAQETLSAFINENVNNALVINSHIKGSVPPAPITNPRGPLRQRYEPDTKELFITAQEFRAFFAKRQVDVREAVRNLAKAGIIKHNGLATTKRIGAGAIGGLSGLNVRCYCFDGEAIGLNETAFSDLAV